MKKWIASVITAFMLSVTMTPVIQAAEKEDKGLATGAKSAILIEKDTGTLIYDKNAHEKLPPASMTKLMTMLLIMEEMDKGNLKKSDMVSVSEKAASMGGSQIFLEAGEEMSANDMLKGIAMASGNDASVAMAEHISGSEDAFVERMNEKLKELKLKNSSFKNTTGLPAEGHYSTAYDMAMIAKELLKYEDITKYTSVYEDYLRKGQKNEFWLVNTNKLVKFYKGVDGLKTGFTSEAKYCLTATAEKNGMRVISVVMGAKTTKDRNSMVTELLNHGFGQYETNKLFNRGDKITELKMFKSDKGKADVVVSQSVSTLHKKNGKKEKFKVEKKLKENLDLPLKKGDKVGTLIIKSGDKTVSTADLVMKEDLEPASYFQLLKRTLQKVAKID
ncbi:D-alanyl-D-alanine carboxypeptidase family protein [Aciduricibacillus chroicocephali]|uniref:serine-type D-Ala-D-Ala carboxypeptidase n=1 Tax=Aciduricibacillus chroicocephali TaxID=3054939 RepID=A0ABY9KRP3_9BACI|nr:D-alanyl-D-alanine carboxypeptidase family protein [Bacillaceae bacterium 44XB]